MFFLILVPNSQRCTSHATTVTGNDDHSPEYLNSRLSDATRDALRLFRGFKFPTTGIFLESEKAFLNSSLNSTASCAEYLAFSPAGNLGDQFSAATSFSGEASTFSSEASRKAFSVTTRTNWGSGRETAGMSPRKIAAKYPGAFKVSSVLDICARFASGSPTLELISLTIAFKHDINFLTLSVLSAFDDR